MISKFNSTSEVVETKMPNFRETRGCVTYAYPNKFINEQEFAILCDPHKSTGPEFPNWNCDRFNSDEKTNDECMAEFLFYKEDICDLAEQMQLPDENAIQWFSGSCIVPILADMEIQFFIFQADS